MISSLPRRKRWRKSPSSRGRALAWLTPNTGPGAICGFTSRAIRMFRGHEGSGVLLPGLIRGESTRPDLQRAIVVRDQAKPDVLPEPQTGDVVIHDVEVAFLDSLASQGGQAFLHQTQGDSLFAKFLSNRQVAQNAAPPVVTAKHRSDQPVSAAGDETQAAISS